MALVLLILFGWAALRLLPRQLQRPVRPALQLDVRADRARHVLRDHDRRHRPLGRLDRRHGQRRLGPAQPLRPRPRPARRRGRGCRGRHPQRPDRDAAEHPAVHRHAGDHARRQRHRAAARRQPVGLGLLRHRLHRARPGRPAGPPGPGADGGGGLRPRLGPAQLHRVRPLRAGGRRRRGRGPPDGPAGRPGEVPGLRRSAAPWPASPASSSPPSSAPASRPRASAGSCSRSPRSWSAARC